MSAIVAFGSTVTVTLNAVPAQLPDVGVTEYVTDRAASVELTSVPVANEAVALAKVALDIPERPVTTGAVHEYVVPDGTISPFSVV
jgi:hypothetical protein